MTTDKPQRETREELSSTAAVLRQDRLPRERKMAREREALEGADEARYSERGFRPRHPATLDEVRAAVDALKGERRALPEPKPAPVVEAPPPPVDEAKRAALEPATGGRVVAVETRYRTSEGEVVEATYEKDGGRRSGLYVLEHGTARALDDVASRIDSLPMPAPAAAPVATPPPREESPSAPAVEAAPEAKKGLAGKLRFGRSKGDAPPAAAPQPAPEPAPAEETPKKGFASRLKLGRSKTAEAPPAEAPAAADAPAPADATEPADKPAGRRFGFRRK